ncbi:MAG: type II toxin-antitoxin system HicB family antitoxin [Thermoguttaceae bacterium]|nr:type II toxin-antitoxin system HicB family antitoxin [Thermoguttaceae bacterium]
MSRISSSTPRFHSYFAVFEYGEKSIGVYFPDLPGATSGGDSVDEAAECARECLALHLYGTLEDGAPIPPPSPAERLTVGPSEKLVRVDVDLAEFYPEEFGVGTNGDGTASETRRA